MCPSQYFNIVFTCIFIIEAILRIIALRWGYFQQRWNVFDFVIVVLSIVGKKLSGYRNLCHAIENTANQNTGKPFYIWQYNTQPSHRAPRVCRIDCVDHCIFYGVVMWRSLVVYHGISNLSHVFSWYQYTLVVYRENTSDSWDNPWYTTRERCITTP